MRSFFQRLLNQLGNKKPTRRTQRPHFEVLEDRTTPTSLLSIAGNPGLITDANAPGTLSLRLVFDGSLSTSFVPLASFPTSGEMPGASVTFANGFFTTTNVTNDTYVANFSTTDQNVNIPNIDVQASGARDASNAVVPTVTVNDVFSINTLNPVVQSVAVNKATITSADAGLNFIVTVTYKEAMQTTLVPGQTTPVLTFNQNVASAITFTSGVWDGTGKVYTATYKIGSGASFLNLAIPSVNITIDGAKNLSGFGQLPFTQTNAFTVDTTSNPNGTFPAFSTMRVVGDFNGDSLTDVAAYYKSTGRWLVSLSTGTSFLAPKVWASFSAGTVWAKQMVGDFNNDGKDDIANFYTTNGNAKWLISLSTGSTFTTTVWANDAKIGTKGWTRHLIGDFNNDGRTDIASFLNPTGVARWYVHLSNGATAFTTTLWANFKGLALTGWTQGVVGDFNNDGKDDIANFFNRSGLARWWVSTSSGFAFTTTSFGSMPTPVTWSNQMAGDFNNDGFADLVSFKPTTNEYWVSLSNGSSFTTTLWLTIPQPSGLFQVVGDFNGDGKTDLGLVELSSGQMVIAQSSGTNFAFNIWGTLASTAGLVSEFVGDFTGDGKLDLAHFYTNNSAAQWWVSKNNVGTFTTTQWR